ncbi:PCNA-interacting partner-like [Oncorhynchus kisutch]|uniref:PCNA-interacting partner-like n=1 Tax=Oncorhynchus kisutch TaxID=8019 RepID=UPI00099FCE8C|nr:PCNA-interacting partner-like [Oncorhynchus kisutch]XP_020346539.1 PCNA-interacting partner-like [Oncorhynchus kisutch]
MSLFLAVTSFASVVQLGGKGYAPPESDLRKHVKGLSDFVHFTENLEEILGDNPNPSLDTMLLTTPLLMEVGRLKVLIALLDEDALAPPFRNKAVLLSVDQAVLSGEEGTCMLLLFRCPRAPLQNPMQPHVQERQDQLKPKARSQFACTYQDDLEPPLNRVLDFPSIIQGPTCVQQAPKWTLTTVDSTSAQLLDSRVEVYPEAERKEAQRGGTTRGVATALGPRSGAGGGGLKTNIQTEGSSKACKRKLVDCSEHCGSENQLPLKKPLHHCNINQIVREESPK